MLGEPRLKAAVQVDLDGISNRRNIKNSFGVQPDFGRLPRPAELAMFRVLQESLTNVHRHSGSEIARIRLFEENGSAVLEVEDEGKGLPSSMLDLNEDDVPSSFGVGLRGMTEPLRDLGGMIELKRGRDRKGAIVRAVVPGDKSEVQDHHSSSDTTRVNAA